jgi:coenzyme F420-0:L-glutamate ligase/coenzyme F420-1:gamma-L-glutamate ligase
VDELCSASELVRGKLLRNPAAIIRNYKFSGNEGTVKSLLRPDKEDLFR